MLDIRIDPKYAEEEIIITFNYSSELGGEVLSGTITSVVEVVAGVDAGPGNMINGQPIMHAGNTAIMLPIHGGVKGNTYRIKVTSETTEPLITLTRAAIITIE